jgi:hypothetical protein
MEQDAAEGKTRMASFSVYPATAHNIRSTSGHFGSVGRGIQVAVEILFERAQRGELLNEEPDWDVQDDLIGVPREAQDNLKVPLGFSILHRTEKLIGFLAGEKYYGDRNTVIMYCGTLLLQLYSDFIGSVLTAAERRERSDEFNAKLDAKVEAILGDAGNGQVSRHLSPKASKKRMVSD